MDDILMKQLLTELKSTNFGTALKYYLDKERKKIDSVSDCKTLEEVKGKQLALTALKDLFYFLGDKPESGGGRQNYV